MKTFQTPILSMSLVGLFLLSGLDAPPVHADFIFGPPVNLGPNVNTSRADSGPSLSPDGLTLYFCDAPFDIRPNGHGGQDIWVTTRVAEDAPWEMPVNLGPTLNTSFNEGTPCISSDGLTLYFSSTRPGGFGSTDLWMTTRSTTSDPWGTPTNLGATVNTKYTETMPSISADGLELYFGEWQDVHPGGYGDLDIWVTTRKTQQDPWDVPRNLGAIVNSGFQDTSPHISPDGRMLLFWSTRPDGHGSSDIWMARRTSKDDPWGTPVNVGVPVNTSTHDDFPRISWDGSTLYFASAREGGYGFYDIWQAPIIPIVDFNADGMVDLVDLVMLIESWDTDDPLYDIGPYAWGDGVVDVEDLKVFIAEWEKQNPPAQP